MIASLDSDRLREPDVRVGDVWQNRGKLYEVVRLEGSYHCILHGSKSYDRAFTPLMHEGNGWTLVRRRKA